MILHNRSLNHPAIIEASTGRQLTYKDIINTVNDIANEIRTTFDRSLIFLYANNKIDSILIYLACRTARFPLALIEPHPVNFIKLVSIYEPPLIYLPTDISLNLAGYARHQIISGTNYCAYVRTVQTQPEPHPDVSLLLTTSGSTGNPKLVQLSERNLQANAISIVKYLNISSDQSSIQSLPMHYSYGLSLINSYLLAGGTILLTEHSFMRPEFWHDFDNYACTSFAGVPYMYETLHRLRFNPAVHPTLRTMTQAGGGLRPELIAIFYEKSLATQCQFFVMYGQTEATARISYVPTKYLREKIGSIGIPIPGGSIELSPAEDTSGLQELVYRGQNVMLGYARNSTDLTLGDQLHGILRTGDLARVDDDGFFYLVGRLKRFTKLFGKRINLTDVEWEIEHHFPVSAVAVGGHDHLSIFMELHQDIKLTTVTHHIAHILGITPRAVTIHVIDKIPVNSSNKKDFKAFK